MGIGPLKAFGILNMSHIVNIFKVFQFFNGVNILVK